MKNKTFQLNPRHPKRKATVKEILVKSYVLEFNFARQTKEIQTNEREVRLKGERLDNIQKYEDACLCLEIRYIIIIAIILVVMIINIMI